MSEVILEKFYRIQEILYENVILVGYNLGLMYDTVKKELSKVFNICFMLFVKEEKV